MTGHSLAASRSVMHNAVAARGRINVCELTQWEPQTLHTANQQIAHSLRSFSGRFVHNHGDASDSIGFIDLRDNRSLIGSLNRVKNFHWAETKLS